MQYAHCHFMAGITCTMNTILKLTPEDEDSLCSSFSIFLFFLPILLTDPAFTYDDITLKQKKPKTLVINDQRGHHLVYWGHYHISKTVPLPLTKQ